MGHYFSRLTGTAANSTVTLPSSIPVLSTTLTVARETITTVTKTVTDTSQLLPSVTPVLSNIVNAAGDNTMDNIASQTANVYHRTASEPGHSVASWTISVVMAEIINHTFTIGFVLLHLLPLILARRASIHRKSLRAWIRMVLNLHFKTTLVLALLSLILTIGFWFDGSYILGSQLITRQVTECAFRFRELACETSPNQNTERECFALGMCLVQPLWAVSLQTFAGEWFRWLGDLHRLFWRSWVAVGLINQWVPYVTYRIVYRIKLSLDLHEIVTGFRNEIPDFPEEPEVSQPVVYQAYRPPA